MLIEEELTHSVIGVYYDVYRTLGYGFLEHVYVSALEHELQARGHRVGRQVSVPVTYKGRVIATQRLDMVVDERLVIEVKSSAALPKGAVRQLYSYLCGTRLEVGLLFHFGPEPRFYRLISVNRVTSAAEAHAVKP